MLARIALCLSAAYCMLSLFVSPCTAQVTNYVSNAAIQMAGIRQDAVGLNNSVEAINRNTLNVARGFRPNANLSQATRDSTTIGAATFPSAGGASKPFSGIVQTPTVSPYLGLFNSGIIGDEVDNYNTFVRPQLRQQAVNTAFQREAQQLNARFQQLSARPAYNMQGSESMMGTGHRTLFGYYSHFYPGKQR